MRLIDADALDKRIYNDIPISVFGSIKKMAAVREIIAEEPTVGANHIADDGKKVDAVLVVRCEDCRHANECHKSVQYTRNEPNAMTIGYSSIEWCSKGERREEDETYRCGCLEG